MATEAEVRSALGEVLDPEYPISILDLGLVRGIEVEGDKVRVKLTFTSLGCPCVELIREDVRSRLRAIEGVHQVEIEEVFEPWDASAISRKGREILRSLGVC
ncbi:MAG: benzoyl-CoA oxygenase [Pyrinomonas sp.]|uniref:metal-sulfur cluster assembly factor n=1 Tax=Pyrinomonas sp. TaxID=2080306 RepID=UPI00332A95C4